MERPEKEYSILADMGLARPLQVARGFLVKFCWCYVLIVLLVLSLQLVSLEHVDAMNGIIPYIGDATYWKLRLERALRAIAAKKGLTPFARLTSSFGLVLSHSTRIFFRSLRTLFVLVTLHYYGGQMLDQALGLTPDWLTETMGLHGGPAWSADEQEVLEPAPGLELDSRLACVEETGAGGERRVVHGQKRDAPAQTSSDGRPESELPSGGPLSQPSVPVPSSGGGEQESTSQDREQPQERKRALEPLSVCGESVGVGAASEGIVAHGTGPGTGTGTGTSQVRAAVRFQLPPLPLVGEEKEEKRGRVQSKNASKERASKLGGGGAMPGDRLELGSGGNAPFPSPSEWYVFDPQYGVVTEACRDKWRSSESRFAQSTASSEGDQGRHVKKTASRPLPPVRYSAPSPQPPLPLLEVTGAGVGVEGAKSVTRDCVEPIRVE